MFQEQACMVHQQAHFYCTISSRLKLHIQNMFLTFV
jgi:hypothetical protein